VRRLFSAAFVLTCTLSLLALLVHLNPFDRVCDAMDRLFSAPPKWTQVTNLYCDPRTQEVTHGADPVNSLSALKNYWHERGGSRRIVFVGNSQMHAISLAAAERPVNVPEKTYVDLVVDDLRGIDPNELLYRLSSSDMSYPEVLWELSYMFDDPDLRPQMVILQMNYQAFWTGGIRESMLPMLHRPSFRARMERFAASGHADSTAYADALRRYDQSVATSPTNSLKGDSGLTSVFDLHATPGYKVETRAREWLAIVSPTEHRAALRESFENALYRGRLYLLRLKPSTARSISGSRLLAARSAVDSIADLCAINDVQLLLFHAPVNPVVSLYRTPGDREGYHDFVNRVASHYHLTLLDFENSIDAEHWGHLLNGPEPLHMSRAAHHQMAKQVLESLHSMRIWN
jgi:hypothetical protein